MLKQKSKMDSLGFLKWDFEVMNKAVADSLLNDFSSDKHSLIMAETL